MKKNHNLILSYVFEPDLYYKILFFIAYCGGGFILLLMFLSIIISNFNSLALDLSFILIISYLFSRRYRFVLKIDYYDDDTLVITTKKSIIKISTNQIKYMDWISGEFTLIVDKKLYIFVVSIVDENFISIMNDIADKWKPKIGIFLKMDMKE